MSLTLLPQLYDLVMKRVEEEMYDVAAPPSLSRRNEVVLLLVHCDDDSIVDNSDVVEKE